MNRLFTRENSRLQQQDNLAVAQGSIALNLINVYRALGGGWEIRCRDGAYCRSGTTATASEAPPPFPFDRASYDERLHLGTAAVDEQFDPSHEAAVVRS